MLYKQIYYLQKINKSFKRFACKEKVFKINKLKSFFCLIKYFSRFVMQNSTKYYSKFYLDLVDK